VIRVKLREAIESYERRKGERLTYARVAELTGLAKTTIESIGARPGYNATLDVVDRLCQVLDCEPGDLLEHVRNPRESAGEAG
jgi:DNA-binding Xre family transcriptional regulator